MPAFPIGHGQSKYKADQNNRAHTDDDRHKASYGDPTLTPGIFTMYYPHGTHLL